MPRRATDAIAILIEDHKAVKKLFKTYKSLVDESASEAKKRETARQICHALKIHAEVEEEIFYPAVRAALDDDDMMDEATVEHMSAKELIGQIEAMSPGDELYDAKVTVLGEYINHHVGEEEGEMFPKARKAVDVKSLGEAIEQRKMELEEQS